jgi:uncharacterized protein YkwD
MFGNIFKKTYSIALAVSIVCCVSPLAFFTSSVNEGDSAQVTQEDLHDLAMEISFMVNEARTENGLKPLYIVPHLCDYSHVRVRESVHKFSHFRPTQAELSGSPDGEEGENFDSYLRDENYPYLKAAENLAASEDPCTPEDAFYQWQSSTEGHWEAILDPDMTHMGVAVTYEHKDRNSETYQDDPFEWYWELLMIQASPETAVVEDPDNPGMKKRIYFDRELDGQYLPAKYEIIPESTGDLSGDGVVDSFDYITILQYIEYQDALAKMKAGKEYDESILDRPVTFNALQIEAADCFKDGVININDAKVLQKFVLGEVKTLPYEF